MEDVSQSDAEVLRDALVHAVRFTYRNSPALVGVSFVWFVAALPIVTIGPATLGAYRAVIGIREPEPLDVRAVFGTVRKQIVHAGLLGLLPLAFWGASLFNAFQYAATGDTISLLLFLAAFYIGTYLAMQAIPAFVALAHGERGYDAISFGRSWLSDHTTLALTAVLATSVLAAVLLALTIAFPVFFAGIAGAFHVAVVDDAYSEFAAENADQVASSEQDGDAERDDGLGHGNSKTV